MCPRRRQTPLTLVLDDGSRTVFARLTIHVNENGDAKITDSGERFEVDLPARPEPETEGGFFSCFLGDDRGPSNACDPLYTFDDAEAWLIDAMTGQDPDTAGRIEVNGNVVQRRRCDANGVPHVEKIGNCPGCGEPADHKVCKPIHVARTWPDGSYK
jgi:hypothetical protein